MLQGLFNPTNLICLYELFDWKCRGAGGRNSHNLMRDCIRWYRLDFVAILEPRISRIAADKVAQRIGLSC